MFCLSTLLAVEFLTYPEIVLFKYFLLFNPAELAVPAAWTSAQPLPAGLRRHHIKVCNSLPGRLPDAFLSDPSKDQPCSISLVERSPDPHSYVLIVSLKWIVIQIHKTYKYIIHNSQKGLCSRASSNILFVQKFIFAYYMTRWSYDCASHEQLCEQTPHTTRADTTHYTSRSLSPATGQTSAKLCSLFVSIIRELGHILARLLHSGEPFH